jgi:peptidoglycan hydrolase CwlO-like protein
LAIFFTFSSTALADQFDDQINTLKQQAAAQANQAAALQAQANSYASEVAGLQAQINAVQTQINLNQDEFNQVSANIAQNKIQLAAEKVVLGANIKEMYLASTVTPLEMLASSSSFSDFFDEQQYQDKIKTKIQDAMGQIEALQKALQGQQVQLTHILDNEQGQQTQLAASQYKLSQLEATAQQGVAAANAAVQNSNAQIATLRAQQAAAIAAASRRVSAPPGASGGSGGACDNGSGNGGYPMVWCNAAQDSEVDSWGMYNRECVSYAAWAANQNGHYVPYGLGNANQWPAGAEARGITVNSTPEIGDVAIWMGGTYGHAMIVDSIGNGTVTVASMNADDAGHFEYDSWATSALVFIHF